MLKKTIIMIAVLFLLFSISFASYDGYTKTCDYEGDGDYDCGSGDFDSCHDKADDIRGRCWLVGSDNKPGCGSYGFVDELSCKDRLDDLYITCGNYDKPGCGDKAGGAISSAGSADCEFGYVDCVDSDLDLDDKDSCQYMGCETYCITCSSNAQCVQREEPTEGQNAYCLTQGNCKNCEVIDKPCILAYSDNHCDRDLADGDGYYCYYNTDIDCGVDSNGDLLSGAALDAFCNGNGRSSYKANPYTRECVIPSCYSDASCESPRTCHNPGEWNAFCARELETGNNFLSEAVRTITDDSTKEYLFITYERANRYYMDIYYETNELYNAADDITKYDSIQKGLKSGVYFNVDSQTYRIFFTVSPPSPDFTLDLYTVDFLSRLTYNIFPVCGNGICETCESADNCLHYPPESCMSCPVDCPYVNDEELDNFNAKFNSIVNYGNILVDNDLSCQIKTLDENSICNPLCVTHDFIDANGCVYNRYRSSYPVYSDGEIAYDNFFTLSAQMIEFKNERINIMTDANGGFLGEASEGTYDVVEAEIYNGKFYSPPAQIPTIKDELPNVFLSTSTGNGECLSNCECATDYCSKTNENYSPLKDEDYGHCCPIGFEWTDTDAFASKYCDGEGHLLSEYSDVFGKDDDSDCYIDMTVAVDNGFADTSNARKTTDFVCDTNPSCASGLKSSCINYDIDPICAYYRTDGGYEPIKEDGVLQCRKQETFTETIIPDIQCIINSHAWALSKCNDYEYLGSGISICWDDYPMASFDQDNPRNIPFCVTDNSEECWADQRIAELLTGPVVLRSISYEDFCTTKSLVCGEDKSFTNTKTGGTIDYTNCPQDAISRSNELVGYWSNIGPTSISSATNDFYGNYEITIGRYCSVYGNDFAKIMDVNAGRNFKRYTSGDENYYTLDGSESVNLGWYRNAGTGTDVQGLYTGYVIFQKDPIIQANGKQFYEYTLNSYDTWAENKNYIKDDEYSFNDDSDFTIVDYQKFTDDNEDEWIDADFYSKTTHLPTIDRDEEEKLYHYLWNRETCVEIFGEDKVPSCDGVSTIDQVDEKGNPAHPEPGIADIERHVDKGNHNVIYSREYCENFWKAFEKKYKTEFDWEYTDANQILKTHSYIKQGDVLSWKDSDGNTVSVNVINTNIANSSPVIQACIFWYEPFLDSYYETDEPFPWWLMQMVPPWADYYRFRLDTVREHADCGSNNELMGYPASPNYPNKD